MARSSKDVWDLTDKEGGDHVLIAFTVDECQAVMLALDEQEKRDRSPYHHMSSAHSARREVANSLRDQKDIE